MKHFFFLEAIKYDNKKVCDQFFSTHPNFGEKIESIYLKDKFLVLPAGLLALEIFLSPGGSKFT